MLRGSNFDHFLEISDIFFLLFLVQGGFGRIAARKYSQRNFRKEIIKIEDVMITLVEPIWPMGCLFYVWF